MNQTDTVCILYAVTYIMFITGFVTEMTGHNSSAFYVGSSADICAATMFGLILFVNRKKSSDQNSSSQSTSKKKSEEDKDSGVDEVGYMHRYYNEHIWYKT